MKSRNDGAAIASSTTLVARASSTLLAAAFVVACAETAEPAPGPVTTIDSTPPGKETAAEADAASPPAPAPLPPADPNAGECKGEKTQTACFTCCDKAHETGAAVFYVALFGCICEPQNCAADCASTICDDASPGQPNAACNACMAQKNAACQAPVAAACANEPDCVAYDTCVSTSGCAAKKAQ